MRIEIPLYDGFDEVDAVAPYEVLANAAAVIDGLEVELVGAHGPGTVTASHGMRVEVEQGLTGTADLVLVPGGGWRHPSEYGVTVREGDDRRWIGARREHDEGVLPARLADLHEAGAAMASVCTGAMLLAKAGITDGRPATTHRAALEDLRASGALVDDEARVVDDGDVLTAGGVTSGLDLALHIVEREWGEGLAAGIATLMEHERVGPVRATGRARLSR